MRALIRSSTALAATACTAVALTVIPPADAVPVPSPAPVSREVSLSAVTVPPGGLITSFLGNQLLYCSLICTSVVQGVAEVSVAGLQTPAAFLTGLQSGNVLKAIGAAAASVTGAAEAAAADVIFKDGMMVAPRALNALEVGVVGLLDAIPAATRGLPELLTALQTARADTFAALNAPIVVNPAPTASPHGVVQVAVIGAINVVAAVIFPAFNHVLLGVFQVPNAVAQKLALTGDPLQALGAGAAAAATVVTSAVKVVGDSIVTAIDDVRTAIEESRPAVNAVEQPAAAGRKLEVPRQTGEADPMPSRALAAPESTAPDPDSTAPDDAGPATPRHARAAAVDPIPAVDETEPVSDPVTADDPPAQTPTETVSTTARADTAAEDAPPAKARANTWRAKRSEAQTDTEGPTAASHASPDAGTGADHHEQRRGHVDQDD